MNTAQRELRALLWLCPALPSEFPAEHLPAVEKLRGIDIEEILTAHDYHPYGWQYRGSKAVVLALDACVAPLLQIRDLIRENPGSDDEAVRLRFNELDHRPTVNIRVIAAMREAMDENHL